jgi:hypothetical protein
LGFDSLVVLPVLLARLWSLELPAEEVGLELLALFLRPLPGPRFSLDLPLLLVGRLEWTDTPDAVERWLPERGRFCGFGVDMMGVAASNLR